jgi:hypothetical protein
MDEPEQPPVPPTAEAWTGEVPAWARREDARARRAEVTAGREGWTMVLNLVVPLVMILLAGAFAWFGLK